MIPRLAAAAALVALVVFSCAPVEAGLTIGLSNVDFSAEHQSLLTSAGHTVVLNPDLSAPITVDTLFLGRNAPIAGNEANVLGFLNGGGTVMTELSGTDWWFDGTLGSFAGTQLNGWFVPSGSVLGGNTVTVTDPADPLAGSLPASWVTGDPIGVINAYGGLDPAIVVPIELLGSSLGDLPIVGHAGVGNGTAVLFFTDFADFNPGNGYTDEEVQLLLNAVELRAVIPEPTSLAIWGALLFGMGVATARRRRATAA